MEKEYPEKCKMGCSLAHGLLIFSASYIDFEEVMEGYPCLGRNSGKEIDLSE